MKISRFVSVLGATVLLSGTALVITISRAHAQETSVFGSQRSSEDETSIVGSQPSSADETSIFGSQRSPQDDIAVSPDKKAPPPTITGNWSGTIDDNLAGSGTLDVDFTEASNGTLGGTWTFMFSEGTDFGTVVGKATSKKVAISFVFAKKPPFVHCKFSIATKGASDTEISADYRFTACGPLTKKEHGSLQISPTM